MKAKLAFPDIRVRASAPPIATMALAVSLVLLVSATPSHSQLLAYKRGARSRPSGPAKQIFEYPGSRQAFSKTLAVLGVPAYVVSATGTNRGILIKEADSNGFGSSIGLQAGDVLLSLNQRVVQTAADADRILYATPEGQVRVMFVHPTESGLQLYNAPVKFAGATAPTGEEVAAGSGSSAGGARQDKSPADKAAAIAQVESYVVDLINHDRQTNGSPPISKSDALSNLARSYAQEMAAKKFFAHVAPDGRNPQDRAAQAGLTVGVFENISWERSSNLNLIAAARGCQGRMMAEPPNQQNHRSNILDPAHACVGVGIALDGDNKFLMVQEFSHHTP